MSKKKSEMPHGYRYLPVPGTGKTSRYKCLFRYPKTAQEKRMDFQEPEIYLRRPTYRSRRKADNIPCAYWDQYRTDAKMRCWKHSRKTQWRKKLPTKNFDPPHSQA